MLLLLANFVDVEGRRAEMLAHHSGLEEIGALTADIRCLSMHAGNVGELWCGLGLNTDEKLAGRHLLFVAENLFHSEEPSCRLIATRTGGKVGNLRIFALENLASRLVHNLVVLTSFCLLFLEIRCKIPQRQDVRDDFRNEGDVKDVGSEKVTF